MGENVYFSGSKKVIGLCSRVKLECNVVIDGRVAPLFYGGEKFALEPTRGCLLLSFLTRTHANGSIALFANTNLLSFQTNVFRGNAII